MVAVRSGLALLKCGEVSGELLDLLTPVAIVGTDPKLVQVVEDIQFGNGQSIETVDAIGVADDHAVEPATATRSAGRRTKLLAVLSNPFSQLA